MITDYFYTDYIITTYNDEKNDIYQINVLDRQTKKTYKTIDYKMIKKIIKKIK